MSYIAALACFAAGVLAGWLIDRALARLERRRARQHPEARTFIEVHGAKRDVNEFGPEDSDFHFESSQELWTARRKPGRRWPDDYYELGN